MHALMLNSFDTGYPVLSKCHQSFLHRLFKVIKYQGFMLRIEKGQKECDLICEPNSFTIVTHFENFQRSKTDLGMPLTTDPLYISQYR